MEGLGAVKNVLQGVDVVENVRHVTNLVHDHLEHALLLLQDRGEPHKRGEMRRARFVAQLRPQCL